MSISNPASRLALLMSCLQFYHPTSRIANKLFLPFSDCLSAIQFFFFSSSLIKSSSRWFWINNIKKIDWGGLDSKKIVSWGWVIVCQQVDSSTQVLNSVAYYECQTKDIGMNRFQHLTFNIPVLSRNWRQIYSFLFFSKHDFQKQFRG